jgi:hypothetical protein
VTYRRALIGETPFSSPEERSKRVRGSVHQSQLGLERGDAARGLGAIEVAPERLFGQALEAGCLLVAHQRVTARLAGCFHDDMPP